MTSLTATLTDIVSNIFEQCDLPSDLGKVFVSDRPDLAQFQCNGAMAAAKHAKKAPRQVAESIVETLKALDIFEKVDIAGPGFINLTVTDTYLENHLRNIWVSEQFGVRNIGAGKRAILDYGGPNVGKPMHVGHLRTAIIGDSLRRILSYAGYKTLGDVHLGDWGTQMGMILSELEMRYPDWPYFDKNFTGPYPEESPVTIEDFAKIYPEASKACKEDPVRHERAKQATVELQNKRPGYYALWQHFMSVSIESMQENFTGLNVHFDLWNGEASVHDLIAPMVEKLKLDGHAVDSDGALVVPVAKNDDKKEFPPLILYKQDGAVMYSTTDLATIVERMNEYSPSKIIYVVDQRQHLHLEQVFRAAKIGRIVSDKTELIHVGHGTMNGTDGKPFKTRAGGVMRLDDLLKMAQEKAIKRLKDANIANDISDDEKLDIATKVGLSALKFADLQNNPVSDYIFDLDRMTSFEGKTGPYILYQAVRIQSLLRKSETHDVQGTSKIIVSDTNRSLILLLSEFPEVIEGVCRTYSPHILADYIYNLAQGFASFYNNCHVLSEKNEERKASHLSLCRLVSDQLETCMGLLGIEIPKRM